MVSCDELTFLPFLPFFLFSFYQIALNEKLNVELSEQQEDLERKEKLVKLQVFEVKRLKRQLKDLVTSAKPIAIPNEHPIVPTYV